MRPFAVRPLIRATGPGRTLAASRAVRRIQPAPCVGLAMVARELIVLAARELVVVIVVIGFIVWVGYSCSAKSALGDDC